MPTLNADLLNETLDALLFDAPMEWKNLTFTPLLRRENPAPDYRTLDEVLADKQARITELSESGSVPELQFVNDGDFPVFLLDGEELLGAKQNRILNLSILAPAKQTLKVPVSCVEAGRWNRQSAEFAAAPRAHYAAGRARKMEQVSYCMMESAGSSHYSNQGEVWRDISAKSARMDVHSPTSAMSEIFETHKDSVEDYVSAFSAGENQVGGVFAINGRALGLELFDSPETFQKLFPKLLRSYALDAVEKPAETASESPSLSARSEAEALLEAIKTAKRERFAAVGLGEDVRLKADGIAGAALEYEDRLVHLSAFSNESRGHGGIGGDSGDASGIEGSDSNAASELERVKTLQQFRDKEIMAQTANLSLEKAAQSKRREISGQIPCRKKRCLICWTPPACARRESKTLKPACATCADWLVSASQTKILPR